MSDNVIDLLTRQRFQSAVAGNDDAPVHGGGGGGDDMLIERVARLEVGMEHLNKAVADLKTDVHGLRSDARGDFRVLFGAIIAVALGLAGLMAKGFGWL